MLCIMMQTILVWELVFGLRKSQIIQQTVTLFYQIWYWYGLIIKLCDGCTILWDGSRLRHCTSIITLHGHLIVNQNWEIFTLSIMLAMAQLWHQFLTFKNEQYQGRDGWWQWREGLSRVCSSKNWQRHRWLLVMVWKKHMVFCKSSINFIIWDESFCNCMYI